MKDDGYKIRDEYGIYYLTFAVVERVDIFSRRMYADTVLSCLKFFIKKYLFAGKLFSNLKLNFPSSIQLPSHENPLSYLYGEVIHWVLLHLKIYKAAPSLHKHRKQVTY